MRPPLRVAPCLALALAVGCLGPRKQRVATFIQPSLVAHMPSRIVVVPFDGPLCTRGSRMIVTNAVRLELQNVLLGDVIPASADDEQLAAETGLWMRGSVDPAALVDARKAYRADAFLFGTISLYKEYDPPLIGLKLRLLSAQTADVLWAAEAVFDARDRDVRRAAMAAFKKSGMKDTLYGPNLVFMSPRLFARFVAQQILAPLQERISLEAANPEPRKGENLDAQ